MHPGSTPSPSPTLSCPGHSPRNAVRKVWSHRGQPHTGWFGRRAGADSGTARSAWSRSGAGGFAGREGSPARTRRCEEVTGGRRRLGEGVRREGRSAHSER
eukprot:7390174-Prymnesium_polylepis.1